MPLNLVLCLMEQIVNHLRDVLKEINDAEKTNSYDGKDDKEGFHMLLI